MARGKRPIPEEKMQFVKENAGKMTLTELMVELNLCKTSVQKCATKAGVSLLPEHLKESREKVEEMIRNNWESMTVSQMARELKVGVGFIYSRAKIMGIELRKLRKRKKKVDKQEGVEYFRVGNRNWLI